MAKICKNCGCSEICIFANPYRTEDCNINWQPVITYCEKCKYLRKCRACCRCSHPNGLHEPRPDLGTFCSYGISEVE